MASAKTLVRSKLDQFLPIILIVAGVIGTIAALIITHDKMTLLENPNFKPSCSINPIISCGSVMQSDQASAFGFPNPYIGLVGFPVLITTGVILLMGAQLKRWYYLAMNAGLLFGVVFAHWLFYQSVYNINALCIYCMAVWVVIIASFWYVTLYDIQKGYLKVPATLQPATRFMRRHHLDILMLWYLIIIGLILHHFWYYFGTLL